MPDMGAAGLDLFHLRNGVRAAVWAFEIELDRVPQREAGMNAYEIMLSESQERMLLVRETAAKTKFCGYLRDGVWTR